MKKLRNIILWTLVLTVGEFIIVNAKESSNEELLKATYCGCKCCEEYESVCTKPESVPDDYECDLNMCTEQFCEVWEKAKCKKDCFCEQCKNKLKKSDYRCMGYKGLPEGCTCKEKQNCKKEFKTDDMEKRMEDMKKKMPEMKENMKKATSQGNCNLPCFCKNCKDKLPQKLKEDCRKMGPPADSCDCSKSKMECPDEKRQAGLKNYQDKLPEMEAKQAIMTGKIPDARPGSSAQEVKARKCNMQCYCDKCSEDSESVKENCKNLVTSRMPDCKCKYDELTCPSTQDSKQNKEGAMCQLFCLCTNCQKDERMTNAMKKSCDKQMKTLQQPKGCECEDKECDILDKLKHATEESERQQKQWEKSEQAKKMKKGRMKPKKKIWDEL